MILYFSGDINNMVNNVFFCQGCYTFVINCLVIVRVCVCSCVYKATLGGDGGLVHSEESLMISGVQTREGGVLKCYP